MRRIAAVLMCICMLACSAPCFAAGEEISQSDWDELAYVISWAMELGFRYDGSTPAQDVLRFVVNPYNAPLFERNYRTEERYDYDWSNEAVNARLDRSRFYATVYDGAVTDAILQQTFHVQAEDIASLHDSSRRYQIDAYTDAYYENGDYYVTWNGGYGGPYYEVVDHEILSDYGNGKYEIRLTYEHMALGGRDDIYCVAQKSGDGSHGWSFFSISDAPLSRTDDSAVKVLVNGERLRFDQNPVILYDRVLVPLRVIFEALGAQVDWDEATQTVTARVEGKQPIRLTVGSKQLYRGGERILLDVPARMMNDRTLVPIRAVSESFDAQVDWDEETQTVSIYTE